MSEPPVLCEGLAKHYGELAAVAGVDLRIETGDVYGYLGPNGAGKTTSMRMMLGLIRPTGGRALLFGRDPQREGKRALTGVAGFVEAPRFYPYLTGRTNLEMLAAFDGGDARARIGEVLDLVELTDRAADKVGGYSHGMRQRLGIAGALLRNPRLLMLDEPTTGLDPAGIRDMKVLVRRLSAEGITVLLSSHQMAEVEELCNSWESSSEAARPTSPAPCGWPATTASTPRSTARRRPSRRRRRRSPHCRSPSAGPA